MIRIPPAQWASVLQSITRRQQRIPVVLRVKDAPQGIAEVVLWQTPLNTLRVAAAQDRIDVEIVAGLAESPITYRIDAVRTISLELTADRAAVREVRFDAVDGSVSVLRFELP
ncbi:hypothetical protein [Ardenticatena maritima]|uniref:Uncharacterized protein n=1 Tax=Ardenticatena maritima TaxID=872965 RepID=A0A0P6Y8B5_9CHLR|nr:hypothetical protein [Ardenticatena maritima]KPL89083.1 hypothetical protein SE16_00615 [Ardenticatena maritima]